MTFCRILLINLFLVCLALSPNVAKKFEWKKTKRLTRDNWVLDDLEDASFKINGSKLTVSGPLVAFNALYKGIVAGEKSKRYYWEFHCIKACRSVGVAKENNYFWNSVLIRGAFFHYGDLKDNLKLLRLNFGDRRPISNGDRIAYILDLSEQELKIYIVYNDRPLGLAFIQKAPYSSSIHPAVVLSNHGSVEIKEKNDMNVDNLLVRASSKEKGK